MSLVSRPGQYTIGVFIGGKAGVQVGPFQEAVYRMDLQNDTRYRIVYIDITDVKKQKWKPHDLVTYLLQCNSHFIITHVHQGKSERSEPQLGWNMLELQAAIFRLNDHSGFPSQHHLLCPVFLQDKLAYLRLIPSIALPTMRVNIQNFSINDYSISKITA